MHFSTIHRKISHIYAASQSVKDVRQEIPLPIQVYSPGRTFPAILIFMQQILLSSNDISITLMASLWANMAGEVVPGLEN